jgi:hypothetical protein
VTRILVVIEMITRDLARRRAVLILLALVPLVFYLARHDDKVGQSVRFASLGVAWAVSTLALFSGTAGKQAEPRLIISGYRRWHLYLGRLTALWTIGLSLAFAYVVLILADQHIVRPAGLALLFAATVFVAAPLGLFIGSLVLRDLEGALILITMLALQFLMDPAKSSAKLLPLWSNRQLGTWTIDLADTSYLRSGLLHGLLYGLTLIAATAVLSAVRLRRRRHLRTAES